MTKVTNENYLNYLTFHGTNVETAEYVVEKWRNSQHYYENEAIASWVDASQMFLQSKGRE